MLTPIEDIVDPELVTEVHTGISHVKAGFQIARINHKAIKACFINEAKLGRQAIKAGLTPAGNKQPGLTWGNRLSKPALHRLATTSHVLHGATGYQSRPYTGLQQAARSYMGRQATKAGHTLACNKQPGLLHGLSTSTQKVKAIKAIFVIK